MMPISTAAPKTGRDITKRVLLGLGVACALLLGGVPAHAQTATPAPITLPPAQTGTLGYYMMQGTRIVSTPFPSAPACFKALADLQKKLPPNTAPIVCAHRRP
jgi:hypothetical protein